MSRRPSARHSALVALPLGLACSPGGANLDANSSGADAADAAMVEHAADGTHDSRSDREVACASDRRNRFGLGLATGGTPSQLAQVSVLAGSRGSVHLVFAGPTTGITNATTAPDAAWIDAVAGAYNRDLIPIVRLEAPFTALRPVADDPPANTNYTSAAKAFAAAAAGLPRRAGRELFVEVWNEPNLSYEWGGTCNHDVRAREYARFLRATVDAIRAIGDTRIRVMNAGLAPAGDGDACGSFFGASTRFLEAMMKEEPDLFDRLDAFASHSYPLDEAYHPNVPPPNRGLRLYDDELAILGRPLDVYITETGYTTATGLSREAVATNTVAAWRLVWLPDARVKAVLPFNLYDSAFDAFNWVNDKGAPYPVYSDVQALRRSLDIPDACPAR